MTNDTMKAPEHQKTSALKQELIHQQTKSIISVISIKTSTINWIMEECEELNQWMPIRSAPIGYPGFIAMSAEFDQIEWLVDDGREDCFFNRNSNNYTHKEHWLYWIELPKKTYLSN
jgi:phenylpyruvate tautomerase PptA (4-oxalocrotonate tautomerase family)